MCNGGGRRGVVSSATDPHLLAREDDNPRRLLLRYELRQEQFHEMVVSVVVHCHLQEHPQSGQQDHIEATSVRLGCANVETCVGTNALESLPAFQTPPASTTAAAGNK